MLLLSASHIAGITGVSHCAQLARGSTNKILVLLGILRSKRAKKKMPG
jgi:hypothetical protein